MAQTVTSGENRPPLWQRAALRRRCLLLALSLGPATVAAHAMYTSLPAQDGVIINGCISALFCILFAWISIGFWSSLAGLAVLLRRYDRFLVSASAADDAPLADDVRAAILFPVYNEDAGRVMEGVRTVWRSLVDIGAQRHFDIYILSDSTNPDAWVCEEEAWHRLCKGENAAGRIFYRHRRVNRKGKSGNVADFCRRWGADYPYMVVFDADSVMSGQTLLRMLRTMEARPDIGILQTAPKSINSRSLLARVQQFSNHLYGPVFAAGLHFWQLGEAQYWGHNAIIRIEPFMRHCHLPVLPGAAPLGGHILSHDFVEAALMRRAGYSVWLAYELEGSFEENPPTLIDELVRDRRWCQGNLQHGKLVLARGFFPTHRALFINGIMSYVSALLWFLFLLASSLQALMGLFIRHDYFPRGPALFPDWPQYFNTWLLGLFCGTTALLFLPKILILALVILRGGARAFGGVIRLCLSVLGEVLISTLLAPVRMLYHSIFVVTTLLGFSVRWNTQNRGGDGTGWMQALRFHWWGVLLGLIWGGVMYLLNPGFFLWLSPIVFGMAISVPLSVLTSRVGLGEGARRLGLFLTPAETEPAKVVVELNHGLAAGAPASPFRLPPGCGFTRAAVIPEVLALHMAVSGRRRTPPAHKRATIDALIDRAVQEGPASLTNKEKNIILGEPLCLSDLHHRIWSLEGEKAGRWGITP